MLKINVIIRLVRGFDGKVGIVDNERGVVASKIIDGD